jgi:hypothetical protein
MKQFWWSGGAYSGLVRKHEGKRPLGKPAID